jgi:hypothetical protein
MTNIVPQIGCIVNGTKIFIPASTVFLSRVPILIGMARFYASLISNIPLRWVITDAGFEAFIPVEIIAQRITVCWNFIKIKNGMLP